MGHQILDRNEVQVAQLKTAYELLRVYEAQVTTLWSALRESCNCKEGLRQRYQEAYAQYKRQQIFILSIGQ